MHIGSDVHVDRTWGSVIMHRRWGDVWIEGRIGQRWKENSPWVFLKLDDRTTVKDWRWGELGVTGVGRNQRLLRSGGSAFGTLVDRRLVHFVIGVWFTLWSAFGSFGVWLALSFVRWVLSFCGSLSLLRVWGKCLKVKWFCKMISGSNEANFGQTEIIFLKFYFL